MLTDRRFVMTFVLITVLNYAVNLSCSSGPTRTSGGSGSETPNSITVISASGHVLGSSSPNSELSIYSRSYVPYNDSGFDTSFTPGTTGAFDAGVLDQGMYNLLFHDMDSGKAVFFSGIPVGPDIGPDTFLLAPGPAGSLRGVVLDPVDSAHAGLPVYIPGSPFCDTADAGGRFDIDGVPAGDYRLLTKRTVREKPGRGKSDTVMVDTSLSLSGGEIRELDTLELN